MTAEQQERINAAVKELFENAPEPGTDWISTAKALYEAWRAAQTSKWEARVAGGSGQWIVVRRGLRDVGVFSEVEARAVCAALNALAESEATE